MTLDEATLKAAHKHSIRHQTEVMASESCGCFYCRAVFRPGEILDWVDELTGNADGEDTALCPKCGIDSVIGDRSGYSVTTPDFLAAMHAYWFERTVYVEYQ